MVNLLFQTKPILSASSEEQPDHYSMLKNSESGQFQEGFSL